ncbi:hypothetical protein AMAG_17612 [Allomyces macrogynus ATCC 38327]|uniref:Uncharacterized protein n=1 Tax=Allomyces macrogynus (strain ATCC 38327) TaxID=578462 RepID=A0A0L0RVE6_ALLM3|nr:hypothetical protein AMAG_17612 [Allomyces macrogynus ATCC 38327]|eukprot:KNE54045.1 hypothetical protein AMAG_17612 [Allomyces macrogynus ATCC 38327]
MTLKELRERATTGKAKTKSPAAHAAEAKRKIQAKSAPSSLMGGSGSVQSGFKRGGGALYALQPTEEHG